jgi:hypothetical protein
MILSNRIRQRCSKVENMSWLKFCVEYDDEFVSHMEIMPEFLKTLKEVEECKCNSKNLYFSKMQIQTMKYQFCCHLMQLH